MDQHSLGSSAFLTLSKEAIEAKQKWEKNRTKCNERFVDSSVVIEHAKKGDLIEFERPLPLAIDYSHWGVYSGDGDVIHVTNTENGKTKVREQRLKDVANKCFCRVNNLDELAQKWMVEPKKSQQIMETANGMVDKDFNYDVINNNCEHFATLCRYGIRFSGQADATDGCPNIRTAANIFAKSSLEAKASKAKSSTNTRKE